MKALNQHDYFHPHDAYFGLTGDIYRMVNVFYLLTIRTIMNKEEVNGKEN